MNQSRCVLQHAFISLFLICTVLANTPVTANAQLPDRPQPGLPERPSPPQYPNDDEGGESGAHIKLYVEPAAQKYWTEVEWQDGQGNWHLVEGWRGYTSNGAVRWFVREAHFGQGPFRWQVYEEKEGILLNHSAPFFLPKMAQEIVEIKVKL